LITFAFVQRLLTVHPRYCHNCHYTLPEILDVVHCSSETSDQKGRGEKEEDEDEKREEEKDVG